MNRIKKCAGEGLGSCNLCTSRGIWNRTWMGFLYEIEGINGCYCYKCAVEIVDKNGYIIQYSDRT